MATERAHCPDMLGAILSVIASGFLIGALARLALPGPDPMPFWLTVIVGMAGAVAGGGIAGAIYGAGRTFDTSNSAFVTLLLEIGAAIAIVAGYRRFVQRRPLSGPEARRFPSRGIGIQQMRERLRRLGVDPDRLGDAGGPTAGSPEAPEVLGPEEVAEGLERLRRERETGAISESEYDEARERLRRY